MHLAIAAGKDGAIYVADRTNMGKFNATTNNIYQELDARAARRSLGSSGVLQSDRVLLRLRQAR